MQLCAHSDTIFQIDKRPWKRLNEREVIGGPRTGRTLSLRVNGERWKRTRACYVAMINQRFAAFTVYRGHRDERSNKRLCTRWKYSQTGSRDTMNRVPTWIYDDSKRPAIY